MRRPPTAKVDFRAILLECLTPDDHRAIVLRAIHDARHGSVPARQWIYQYLMSPLPKTIPVEQDRREATELFRNFVDRLTPEELRIFAMIHRRAPDRPAFPPAGPEEAEYQMATMAIAFQRIQETVKQ